MNLEGGELGRRWETTDSEIFTSVGGAHPEGSELGEKDSIVEGEDE